MEPAARDAKVRELNELRQRAARLEAELAGGEGHWSGPAEYYASYYALTGAILGMLAACTSLLVNIIGATLFQMPSPLWIIRVYLTFPLGKAPLEPTFDNSLALTIGCCLYLATGMLLGIPFQLVLTRFASQSSIWQRFAIASALALGIWLIAFYGVLSWLQVLPAFGGGAYIVQETPWWVGVITHLVFGWTMVLLYPWGLYDPYRLQTE